MNWILPSTAFLVLILRYAFLEADWNKKPFIRPGCAHVSLQNEIALESYIGTYLFPQEFYMSNLKKSIKISLDRNNYLKRLCRIYDSKKLSIPMYFGYVLLKCIL